MKTKKRNTAEWILAGILLLTMLLTFRTNWYVAHHILDDDAASELMLASVIHRDKNLFPPDWYYSTELILHNQLIFGFLFNFFEYFVRICCIYLNDFFDINI